MIISGFNEIFLQKKQLTYFYSVFDYIYLLWSNNLNFTNGTLKLNEQIKLE